MSEIPTAGDPEGMRALARQVAAIADSVRSAQTGAAATMDGLVFEGPAAARVMGSVSDAQAGGLQAAGELEAVAQGLAADAAKVERMNDELRRQAEREAAQEEARKTPDAPDARTPAGKNDAPDPA